MWRRPLTLVSVVVVVLTATSTPLTAATSGTEHSAAALAVRMLAAPDRTGGELVLPADFRTVMGYAPTVLETREGSKLAVRPDGTCSSPLGETRYGFGAVCQSHDLGYDLLRYASQTGEPLGTWARRSLDGAFGERLRDVCIGRGGGADRVGCLAAAAVYQGVVSVNSWRQGFGTPATEGPWSMIIIAAGGCAVLAAGLRRLLRPRLS